MIASRTDPDLHLPRLRANDQLLELRNDALRFSDDEAGAMLENLGVGLQSSVVQALVARTEGWAAGLQLAAVSLRDQSDPAAGVRRLVETRQGIGEYLFSEALDNQPARLRSFLLEASTLEEFDAPTCAAVLGVAEAEADELIADAHRRLVRRGRGTTYGSTTCSASSCSCGCTLDPDRGSPCTGGRSFEKTGEIGRAIRHLWPQETKRRMPLFQRACSERIPRGGPRP